MVGVEMTPDAALGSDLFGRRVFDGLRRSFGPQQDRVRCLRAEDLKEDRIRAGDPGSVPARGNCWIEVAAG